MGRLEILSLPRRKWHITDCHPTSAQFCISVFAISSSLDFSMVAPVGIGTFGRGCGIGGLWIGRLEG